MNAESRFIQWWDSVESSTKQNEGNPMPDDRFVLFNGSIYMTAKELREIVGGMKNRIGFRIDKLEL
jgi:hypothetical protein